MFTTHPTSEYFDFDTFVDENFSMLEYLYEQLEPLVKEEFTELTNEDEVAEYVAFMMSTAIFADVTEIIMPIPFDEDQELEIISLAEKLISTVTLISLIDKGLVKRTGDKFSLTSSGDDYAERIMESIEEQFDLNTD